MRLKIDWNLFISGMTLTLLCAFPRQGILSIYILFLTRTVSRITLASFGRDLGA